MPDPVAEAVSISQVSAETAVEPIINIVDEVTPDSIAQSEPVVDTSDPVAVAVATSADQYIGFDPSIHAVNADGTPRMRAHGKGYALKRGKGGRKSTVEVAAGADDLFAGDETATASETASAPTPSAAPGAAASTSLNSREAAAMIVLTCTTVLSKVVGPEWQAETAEKKNLTDATKVYLDSKGGLNVTPEMALFLAVTGYAVPRLAHENTQSKFSRAWQWCKDRFAVVKSRVGM